LKFDTTVDSDSNKLKKTYSESVPILTKIAILRLQSDPTPGLPIYAAEYGADTYFNFTVNYCKFTLHNKLQ